MADRYPLSHDLSVDVFEDGSAQFVTWGKNIELQKEVVAGAVVALLRAMLAREAKVLTSTISKRDVVIITVDCSESEMERIRDDLTEAFKSRGFLGDALIMVARETFSLKKLGPEQRRALIEELEASLG